MSNPKKRIHKVISYEHKTEEITIYFYPADLLYLQNKTEKEQHSQFLEERNKK